MLIGVVIMIDLAPDTVIVLRAPLVTLATRRSLLLAVRASGRQFKIRRGVDNGAEPVARRHDGRQLQS